MFGFQMECATHVDKDTVAGFARRIALAAWGACRAMRGSILDISDVRRVSGHGLDAETSWATFKASSWTYSAFKLPTRRDMETGTEIRSVTSGGHLGAQSGISWRGTTTALRQVAVSCRSHAWFLPLVLTDTVTRLCCGWLFIEPATPWLPDALARVVDSNVDGNPLSVNGDFSNPVSDGTEAAGRVAVPDLCAVPSCGPTSCLPGRCRCRAFTSQTPVGTHPVWFTQGFCEDARCFSINPSRALFRSTPLQTMLFHSGQWQG